MIICAAVKVIMNNMAGTNEVICGHRHGDCYSIIHQLNSNWLKSKKVEGFIDNNGEFLDRKEALEHAVKCGQLSQSNRWYKEDNNENELYSEDLY